MDASAGSSISNGDYTAPSTPGSALVAAAANGLTGQETVNIVPVPLDVTGRPTVSADMPYTLNLSDPNGPVTGGTIYWGDDTSSEVANDAVTATHVYTTASPSTDPYAISAVLEDSSGTHTVSMNNNADGPSSGTPDTSFAFTAGSSSTGFQSMAVQPDGKIVVCGQTASPSALVARYNSDGTSDGTDFDTSALTAAQAVAIQPVGNQSDIVVAGLATGSQFAMLRYLSDGSLDSSFVDTDFAFQRR